MYWLMMETEHIQYEVQAIRCMIQLLQRKCMQKT